MDGRQNGLTLVHQSALRGIFWKVIINELERIPKNKQNMKKKSDLTEENRNERKEKSETKK
eukprot:scaffold553356_cov14-Prasinocladus_malaysianus.AAC.1